MAASRSVRPKFQEIGASGLRVYGGRIYEEWLPELTGDRGRKVLREMSEQDPVIGGILFAIEMLVRQTEWTFAPKDDSDEAKLAADFAQECLNDLQPHWPDTLSEILTMLPYGWSWFEVVYKYRNGPQDDPNLTSSFDDGLVGWKTWAPRSQDTLLQWELDEQGRVKAFTQSPPPKYDKRTIPVSKSLHFRTKSRKDNPEGVSVLRSAYRPWYFKKHIEQIEGIGIERDLAGLPVMWVPPDLLSGNATTEQKQLLGELQKIVTNIRRDEQEGVIMPLAYDDAGRDMYKLQLISTGGSRQFDTDKIITRYDQRIAMTMMADFVLLGHEQVGSFALSDNKTALFATALGAWLDSIATTITRFELPRLFKMNGMDVNLVPKLSHSDIENADLGKLGTYLQSLASAGMTVFPNPAIEKHLLTQAGIPVPEELPSQTEAMVQKALQEMGLADEMGNPTPEGPPEEPLPPEDGGTTTGAESNSPATLRQKNRTSSAGAAEAAGQPMRTTQFEEPPTSEEFFDRKAYMKAYNARKNGPAAADTSSGGQQARNKAADARNALLRHPAARATSHGGIANPNGQMGVMMHGPGHPKPAAPRMPGARELLGPPALRGRGGGGIAGANRRKADKADRAAALKEAQAEWRAAHGGKPARPESLREPEVPQPPESEIFFNPLHAMKTGRFDFNPMGTSTIVGGSLVKQFGGQAAAIRELHARGKKAGEIAALLGVRPQAVHGQIAKLRKAAALAPVLSPGTPGSLTAQRIRSIVKVRGPLSAAADPTSHGGPKQPVSVLRNTSGHQVGHGNRKVAARPAVVTLNAPLHSGQVVAVTRPPASRTSHGAAMGARNVHGPGHFGTPVSPPPGAAGVLHAKSTSHGGLKRRTNDETIVHGAGHGKPPTPVGPAATSHGGRALPGQHGPGHGQQALPQVLPVAGAATRARVGRNVGIRKVDAADVRNEKRMQRGSRPLPDQASTAAARKLVGPSQPGGAPLTSHGGRAAGWNRPRRNVAGDIVPRQVIAHAGGHTVRQGLPPKGKTVTPNDTRIGEGRTRLVGQHLEPAGHIALQDSGSGGSIRNLQVMKTSHGGVVHLDESRNVAEHMPGTGHRAAVIKKRNIAIAAAAAPGAGPGTTAGRHNKQRAEGLDLQRVEQRQAGTKTLKRVESMVPVVQHPSGGAQGIQTAGHNQRIINAQPAVARRLARKQAVVIANPVVAQAPGTTTKGKRKLADVDKVMEVKRGGPAANTATLKRVKAASDIPQGDLGAGRQKVAKEAANRRLARKQVAAAAAPAAGGARAGKKVVYDKMEDHIKVVDGVGVGKLQGPVTNMKSLPGNHISEAWKADIVSPSGRVQTVVIKPIDATTYHPGEGKNARPTALSPAATGAPREVAAGIVGKHMDKYGGTSIDAPRGIIRDTFDDHDRNKPQGKAYVGEWVGKIDGGGSAYLHAHQELAVFDAVIGNTDRHGGNWKTDSAGRIWPIDHGLAFPDLKGYTGGNMQWLSVHGGSPLSAQSRRSLEGLRDHRAELRHDLEPLIGSKAMKLTEQRIDFMLAHDKVMTGEELRTCAYAQKSYVSIHQPIAALGQARAAMGRNPWSGLAPVRHQQQPAGWATRRRRNQGEMKVRQQKRNLSMGERAKVQSALQKIRDFGVPAHAQAEGINKWMRPVMNRRGRIGWWKALPNGHWGWVDVSPGRH